MSDINRLTNALASPTADERQAAAEELCRMGVDAQPAAVALAQACGDADEAVREQATAALEELGPPRAEDLSALLPLLTDVHADVAYWAATLLGRLAGDAAAAAPALGDALANSPNLAVRQRAAWALGQIGPAAAAALAALQKASHDADPRLQRLATEVTKHSG